MFTISDDFIIARPLPEVFTYVTDLEHLPDWAQGVSSVTRSPAGPTQAGTVFHVTGKVAGRELTVDYRIEACAPEAQLTASGRFAFLPFRETFAFEASAAGTRVRLTNTLAPRGLARLGTPLWSGILGRQIRGDNARLKQVLEAGAAAGGA